MSADVYFYKVSPAGFAPGSTVSSDDIGYERAYFRVGSDVPEWARVVPTVHVVNETIDMFAAGEAMFGERPTSISTGSYDFSTERFHFADGRYEDVSREDLQEFYYDDSFDAHILDRELLGVIENMSAVPNARELDGARVTPQMAEKLLRDYIAGNGAELEDDYASSYYLRPVYVLAKAMFEAAAATVVCEVG